MFAQIFPQWLLFLYLFNHIKCLFKAYSYAFILPSKTLHKRKHKRKVKHNLSDVYFFSIFSGVRVSLFSVQPMHPNHIAIYQSFPLFFSSQKISTAFDKRQKYTFLARHTCCSNLNALFLTIYQ